MALLVAVSRAKDGMEPEKHFRPYTIFYRWMNTMFDHVQAQSAPSGRRGRPCDPNAKTEAQRSKAYRQQKKIAGLKAVKCYLPPEQIAYLSALCEIHDMTIGEAVGLAVTRLIRGESSIY